MAGGEGSRLRPLTLERPKPMVTIGNAPAMEHILNLLRRHGIRDVVVTLHYLGAAIEDYFQSGEEFGLDITYTREDQPLGTAGSVALARELLDEPFLVISGDALTDVDLGAFIAFHRDREAEASLLLYRVPNPLEYGVVITDETGRIERFQEKPSWGAVQSDTVNTGIYLLAPSIFDAVPAGRSVDFSLDVFPALLDQKRPAYGHVSDGYWADVGTLDAYREANADLLNGKVDVAGPLRFTAGVPSIDPTARVDPAARVIGSVYVGRGCEVHRNAVLSGPTVIGDYTVVEERAQVRESIVQGHAHIGADAQLNRSIIGRQCLLGASVTVGEGAVVGDATTLASHASVRAGVRIWPRKFVDEGVAIDRSLIHGEHARRTIFSHGGVAGRANYEVTPEFAARVGAAWGTSLPLGASVVANHDATRPARMIKRALMSGLASVGVGVVDISGTPYPVARFATRLYQSAGGVHVRASPYEPGATDIRFVDARGLDVLRTTERKIEALFFREDFRRVGPGAIAEISVSSPVEAYAQAVVDMIDVSRPVREPLGVVVDYMGGTCGEVLPGILAAVGVRETAIDAAPMPNGSSYQDRHARTARLRRIVPAVGAAFGALLDADGNRSWIVDERGEPLDSFEAIGLLLRAKQELGRVGALVVPFTVPTSVVEYARSLGFEPVRTKAEIAEVMRVADSRNAILTATGRDAFGFPELHAGPDPMAFVGQLAAYLGAHEHSVSEMVREFPPFCVVRAQVAVGWERRGAVMRTLNEHEQRVDEGDLDGVVFGRGAQRATVRPDMDRPVFQIIGEGPDIESARSLTERIEVLVQTAGD